MAKAGKPKRRNNGTPLHLRKDWQEEFFRALRVTRSITQAAEAVGMHRSTLYNEKTRNPEFARRLDEAWKLNLEDLEASAMRRAIEGTESLVIQQGRVVSHNGKNVKEKKWETGLTIFMLKAHGARLYREADNQGTAQALVEAVKAMKATVPGPPAAQ
jgi:hypothetical protein